MQMKKVAIQGIKGSFHDHVATLIFGHDYTNLSCGSFSETVDMVENEKCDYGIIAIENSLAGTILENYKLLRDSYVEIIEERYLQIDHHLLAIPGQRLVDIDTVLSHEMALKQCRKFLNETSIKNQNSFRDTASASKYVGLNQIKGTAAIGSQKAAREYGLEVLASKIQDSTTNYTRFLVIQKPKVTGLSLEENKATIIFSVLNEPGKLALVLNYLNSKKINLTKIESVPHYNSLGTFDMITDLELPQHENFKAILPDLYQLVEEIKILGIYKKEKEPWN